MQRPQLSPPGTQSLEQGLGGHLDNWNNWLSESRNLLRGSWDPKVRRLAGHVIAKMEGE